MQVAQTVNGALRKVILASSGNVRVRGFVAKHGLRLGASRFVAGEDLDACVEVLRGLNERGLYANTTLLGEDVLEEAETREVVEEYMTILSRLHEEDLRANVALKLTHLGLDIDEELAFANVRRLVERAAELGNFIRIDMEYSALVEPTLRIYRRLREAGLDNLGTVLQSYLYRTPDDLESLLPLAPNLRFVKGAYLEPESVAYPRKEEVDAAYLRLVERSLVGGGYTAIATHDERMLDHALAFAERNGIGRDRFELQMLYGVRPQLQLHFAARGYKVLVATPFGPEWFPFFTRRLAERPANLTFVVRNLVRR
jgi:proline dehydrogenase